MGERLGKQTDTAASLTEAADRLRPDQRLPLCQPGEFGAGLQVRGPTLPHVPWGPFPHPQGPLESTVVHFQRQPLHAFFLFWIRFLLSFTPAAPAMGSSLRFMTD